MSELSDLARKSSLAMVNDFSSFLLISSLHHLFLLSAHIYSCHCLVLDTLLHFLVVLLMFPLLVDVLQICLAIAHS